MCMSMDRRSLPKFNHHIIVYTKLIQKVKILTKGKYVHHRVIREMSKQTTTNNPIK